MPRLRIRPDDDIRRVRNVWLGPKGISLPFRASYTAWGLFLVIFIAELLFEAVMPGLHVSVLPVVEVGLAMLAATLLTGALDHDKPLRALPGVYRQHAAALRAMVRRRRGTPEIIKPTRRVRVRSQEINR